MFYPTKPLPYTHANNICIAIQMFNRFAPIIFQNNNSNKPKEKSLTGFKWILTAVQPVLISAYTFTLYYLTDLPSVSLVLTINNLF